jgi:hypothetical protein
VFIGGFGEARIIDKTIDSDSYENGLAKDFRHK